MEGTDNLYTALDDLEQYTRKNSLEIHGIPHDCYSTTEEVVLKLAIALNVNVNPSDIEITHKLKRRDNVQLLSNLLVTKLKRAYIRKELSKGMLKYWMCFLVISMYLEPKTLESFLTKT